MNPSAAKNNSEYKTPHHDKMQAVISKNPRQILDIVWNRVKEIDPTFSEVHENAEVIFEMEKPIFNNRYLVGIVDGVIDLLDHVHVITNQYGCLVNTNTKPTKNDLHRRVIYEIKPHLDSATQLIGQLKTYAEWLKYIKYYAGHNEGTTKPDMVVVTRDMDTGYEDMIEKQGIIIVNLADLF